jgi:hypothetical protein
LVLRGLFLCLTLPPHLVLKIKYMIIQIFTNPGLLFNINNDSVNPVNGRTWRLSTFIENLHK